MANGPLLHRRPSTKYICMHNIRQIHILWSDFLFLCNGLNWIIIYLYNHTLTCFRANVTEEPVVTTTKYFFFFLHRLFCFGMTCNFWRILGLILHSYSTCKKLKQINPCVQLSDCNPSCGCVFIIYKKLIWISRLCNSVFPIVRYANLLWSVNIYNMALKNFAVVGWYFLWHIFDRSHWFSTSGFR
jgi:hypothetical protein